MSSEQFATILEFISNWAVPLLLLFIPLYGLFKGVKIYEVFVEGAKEGFEIAVKIMPYLVAILVAIGLFRDVGLMDAISAVLNPILAPLGVPAEILPMVLVRPLSGSGAAGVMNSIFIEYGPDSFLGMMASVLMGSTETTFYILAVYFGAVNIAKTRHAVIAGLVGDAAGAIAAIALTILMFGS